MTEPRGLEWLVRNEGWTLRKALEHVGVMICERGEPKAAARKRKGPEEEREDDEHEAM